jgi:hypothetical protein
MPAPLHQRLSLIDNRFEVDTKIGEGTFSTCPPSAGALPLALRLIFSPQW